MHNICQLPPATPITIKKLQEKRKELRNFNRVGNAKWDLLCYVEKFIAFLSVLNTP